MVENSGEPVSNGTLPDGIRVYAIGDIHGHVDLLKKIIAAIFEDNAKRPTAQTKLIFLGDYVDRGPDSKGVIDYITTNLPPDFQPVFLTGNHEQLLLDFAVDPLSAQPWLRNGGDTTLLSYGLEPELIHAARSLSREGVTAAQTRFIELLPDRHIQFYQELETFVRIGGYFFVHAGVRPGVPLDLQDEYDLLWIRDEFLECPDDFGAVVVHGHTPTRVPENHWNRIGIDTYAFNTGRLTAVGLEGSNRWFLTTILEGYATYSSM